MKTQIKDRSVYSSPADGSISRNGEHFGLEVHIVDKTPHWQVFGDGHANVNANGMRGTGWLQIDTREIGEKSSKRTMVTLQREDVERLRDLCNLVLGCAE